MAVISRPRPHIMPIEVEGGRQWLCQSVEVAPRGRPSRVIWRWDSNPSKAYKRWRLAWAAAILKAATQ